MKAMRFLYFFSMQRYTHLSSCVHSIKTREKNSAGCSVVSDIQHYTMQGFSENSI